MNRPTLPPAECCTQYPYEWSTGADAGQGVQGALPTTGLYAVREVTQPQLQPGDTLYATMHEGTPGSPGNWSEIGWLWFGDESQPHVFTSSGDVNGVPQEAPQFPIAANETLYFQIVSYGNGYWGNFIYWPANGGWVVVQAYLLNSAISSDTNVVYENWTYYDGYFTVMPPTWIYTTEIEWCGPSGCGWYTMNPTIPTAEFFLQSPPNYPNLAPYSIYYSNPYYYWYIAGG